MEATVHMDTAPAQIGTAGTPNVIAAPTVSAFQSDLILLRRSRLRVGNASAARCLFDGSNVVTDEMFVKLMRDCGTDEETIADLLAQEKQRKTYIKHLDLPRLGRNSTLIFPRPADGIECSSGSIEVWKWFNSLIEKGQSRKLMGNGSK